MNRVLCWKELREHRLVWATIAILATLLIGGAALMFSPGGTFTIEADPQLVRTMAMATALILVVTYGLVCGSILLAGESEGGTQVFLDTLSGRRAPIWAVKLGVGCILAAAQGVALFAISSLGHVARPDVTSENGDLRLLQWAMILVLLSLDALAWGLFASALCRTALNAVGVALGLWFGSWVVSAFFAVFGVNPGIAQTLLAVGAVVASQRIYCRTDQERRAAPAPAPRRMALLLPSWRVLLWLALRQGRGMLPVLAAASVLAGLLIPFDMLLLWPIVSLVIGIVCGVEVFADDQTGQAYRLLASQRLPPGRVWCVKVLCWLTLTALLVGLVWLGAGIHFAVAAMRHGSHVHDEANSLWALVTSLVVFVTLWPLYGFAVGQLCALLFRKPIIAVLLALLLSAAAAGIWVPSLVGGGLALWQVLVVPVLFLAASRLALWAWFSDGLYTRRPLLVVVACGVAALAWVAGMLWYRVVEVPDVGEPFDVPAFLTSLPPPEKNEAGRLMRRASEQLAQYEDLTNQQLRQEGELSARAGLLKQVLVNGWPEGKEGLSRWLDRLFEGAWAKDYQEAARLPLGMIFDPRIGSAQLPGSPFLEVNVRAAELFAARALQLQARGQDERALDHLLTLLALSRQLRNLSASPWQFGRGEYAEQTALAALDHWLQKVGPKQALLERALQGLARHAAEAPSPVGSIKAAYIAALSRRGTTPEFGSPLERQLVRLAEEVPWQKARSLRLLNALFASQVRLVDLLAHDKVRPELPPTERPRNPDEMWGRFYGMNFLEGPAADLGVRGWGRLLHNARSVELLYSPPYRAQDLINQVTADRCRVRGTQLQVALTLYQVQHGKTAASLDKLVPQYFADVPSDPYTGGPFHYEIYKGGPIPEDQLGIQWAQGSRQVAVGQGLLWCQAHQGRHLFVVPRLGAP